MATTSDKLRQIRPFVKLNIPANKKNFSANEKRLISRYYNALDRQGYFNEDNIGYQLISIESKTAPKIAGLPKVKKRFVEVGTIVENGILKTNPKRKVKIRKGKIFVEEKGALKKWFFEYNIAKNWTNKTFAQHIKKQFGKDLKKKRYFAIGAGLKYEVRGSISTSLERLAEDILKLGFGYTPNLTQKYEHKGQTKYLKDWMQQIVVYEELDELKTKQKNKQAKKGAKRGKRNRSNRL